MSLHAKGLLPGSVPVNWLNEHGLFQCLDCNNLVAESHRSSCGAGPKQSVLHALAIIQELGPPLGLVINPSKCELYSQNDMSVFSSQMKQSNMPHLEILGSPIGDTIFVLTLCLKNVHRPLNCFLRLRRLAQLTLKLLYFCYGCVAHFVKWCTWQDPHPLLLLLKDSGILITTFVIALLHAQEWTPVMMLGSRHNSA